MWSLRKPLILTPRISEISRRKLLRIIRCSEVELPHLFPSGLFYDNRLEICRIAAVGLEPL